MNIVINPGSGPISDGTEAGALSNMQHYLTDCELTDASLVRVPAEDAGDGRFSFLIYQGTRCHLVQMPGLPLHRVRFVAAPGQDPWDFPRLYLDGSSWLWCFGQLRSNDFREPDFESEP